MHIRYPNICLWASQAIIYPPMTEGNMDQLTQEEKARYANSKKNALEDLRGQEGIKKLVNEKSLAV